MKVPNLAVRAAAPVTFALTLASALTARADISNFTLVGIEGVGDLEDNLSDRLGTSLNATTHYINVDDCELYSGGQMDVTVRIGSTTGDFQYATAYAPPDKTCSTADSNPEGVDGQCYVVEAQEDLTSAEIVIRVDFDELIGSACDSGDEGTATVYVIIDDTQGTTVNFEEIDFIIDLKPPDAPELTKVTSGDARFTATWEDDNNDPDDVSYTLYYSDAAFTDPEEDGVDAKREIDSKSVAIESNVSNDSTYYVSVVAIDEADNESALSNQISVVPASTQDFWELYQAEGGTDPGGFCFIATAAYGSPLEGELDTLRAFRDQMLRPTEGGSALVDAYYKYGRRWASWIADKPALRAIVRVVLVPVVWVAKVILDLGPYASFVLFLSAIALVRALRRRALGRRVIDPAELRAFVRAPALATAPGAARGMIGGGLSMLLAGAGALVAVGLASHGARAESPRDMEIEIHGGSYSPDVDSAVSGGTPWKDTFGSSSLTLFRMHIDYELWQEFGTLAVGGGFGYGWVDGKALSNEGEKTEDEVGFNLVPLTLSVVYRWDWAAVNYNVPFVPYVKAGLTAGLWWATDAKDSISNARDADGNAHEGAGLTLGWHVSVGLQFLLDIFSSSMATGFDGEAGVNNSYIFAEFTHTGLDDFGSDSSLDLSDDALSFGLAFEF